jgi:hypothetical protein
MENLNKFKLDIEKLDGKVEKHGRIFGKTEYKNKDAYNKSICKLIEEFLISSHTLYILDLFCGYGSYLNSISKQFNSQCIGIDIEKFSTWKEYSSNNMCFFQKDVFNVINNVKCVKPFDIIITTNTLRSLDKGELEKHNYFYNQDHHNINFSPFLEWCNKNSKYLITRGGEDGQLKGFTKVSREENINLFKSV